MAMTTVDEIKSAIEGLSLSERAEIAKWFYGWEDDEWDLQMKADAAAGRFDALLAEAREDLRTGRTQEGP